MSSRSYSVRGLAVPFAALLALTLLMGCAGPRLTSTALPTVRPPSLLITGVDVFDGEQRVPAQDVLVRGEKIEAVGPAGTLADPAALRIDGTGRTLLPGLIDSHVHFSSAGGPPWKLVKPEPERYGRAFLYAGVTSLLLAQHGDPETRLARRAAEGKVLAPRVYLAGPGLTAPHGHPIAMLHAIIPAPFRPLATGMIKTVTTPEEARAAVREVARKLNPPLIKFFYDSFPEDIPHLSREALEAAMAEAKALGMRPVVHVGSATDMIEAAEAGATLFMHVPWDDRLSDTQVQRLAELKIPAIATLRAVSSSQDLEAGPRTAIEREMVDPVIYEQAKNRPEGWGPPWLAELLQRMPEYKANAADNTRRLFEAGVPIVAGTDSGLPGIYPGAGLHLELIALVQAGLPPLEVLKAATSRPAALLDPTGSSGHIAPGQRADLLLVEGDPTRDITALQAIREVILGGVRLERRGLE